MTENDGIIKKEAQAEKHEEAERKEQECLLKDRTVGNKKKRHGKNRA